MLLCVVSHRSYSIRKCWNIWIGTLQWNSPHCVVWLMLTLTVPHSNTRVCLAHWRWRPFRMLFDSTFCSTLYYQLRPIKTGPYRCHLYMSTLDIKWPSWSLLVLYVTPQSFSLLWLSRIPLTHSMSQYLVNNRIVLTNSVSRPETGLSNPECQWFVVVGFMKLVFTCHWIAY